MAPQPHQPRLATLLNNLPGMAYRCHYHATNRTMLFVSQGCLDLIGYKQNELIGSEKVVTYDELIDDADKITLFQEIDRAIAARVPYLCIYRLTTSAGQQRWLLDKGEALFASDGNVEALEGFVTDHSEHVMAFQLLEQRVADRTRKLSALYDILEVASSPDNLQTTISRSLKRALKAVKGRAGTIHLLDKKNKTLRLTAQQGFSEKMTTQFVQITVADSQLTGWVVRHNKPLLIPKMSEDDRVVHLATNELDVYIGVPIVVNKQVQGVLTVLGDNQFPYTVKEEIDLLTSVGEQLGVVLENARLRQQAEHLMVMAERNRLARDLHDSVTQSLYSVTLFAGAGLNMAQSGDFQRASQLLTDVLETSQQALKEMRLLVYKLRPSVLEKEGFIPALRHRLNAVEERAGVKSQLTVIGSPEITAEREEALYHVAQEALNNIIKHANATKVQLQLQQNKHGSLSLTIMDNGKGFDLNEIADHSGLGLITMRERIENLGGTITYQSAIGQGTTIQLCFSQTNGSNNHDA